MCFDTGKPTSGSFPDQGIQAHHASLGVAILGMVCWACALLVDTLTATQNL